MLASGVDESVEREVRVADRDGNDGSLNCAAASKVRFLVEGVDERAVDHPLTAAQLKAAHVLGSVDSLIIDELTDEEYDDFLAALRS